MNIWSPIEYSHDSTLSHVVIKLCLCFLLICPLVAKITCSAFSSFIINYTIIVIQNLPNSVTSHVYKLNYDCNHGNHRALQSTASQRESWTEMCHCYRISLDSHVTRLYPLGKQTLRSGVLCRPEAPEPQLSLCAIEHEKRLSISVRLQIFVLHVLLQVAIVMSLWHSCLLLQLQFICVWDGAFTQNGCK